MHEKIGTILFVLAIAFVAIWIRNHVTAVQNIVG